jgi:hypothetical protein
MARKIQPTKRQTPKITISSDSSFTVVLSKMPLPSGFGDKIISLETIIDYSFKDKSTAWEALQLAGNGFSTKFITNGNKRLAIVGNLVIDTVLSEAWYRSGKPEGESIL